MATEQAFEKICLRPVIGTLLQWLEQNRWLMMEYVKDSPQAWHIAALSPTGTLWRFWGRSDGDKETQGFYAEGLPVTVSEP